MAEISALHTRVMVNCGDHAQDITTAVAVKPGETVQELAERVLVSQRYAAPAQEEYDDYLTIRFVNPAEDGDVK